MEKMVNGKVVKLTKEEVKAIKKQWKESDKEKKDNQWLQDRIAAYPPIAEQLDIQYWDSVNGTTVWADTIEQIKKDYPKPKGWKPKVQEDTGDMDV